LVHRYVALLRGINVGSANRVAMADLRAMVSGFGHRDVVTALNSGNIVFTADSDDPIVLAAQLQAGLASRLAVDARVTVVGRDAFDAAVASNPLASVAEDPSRLMVVFPATAADFKRLKPLADSDWSPEAFALGAGVAFMWCPGGVADSRVGKALNRALGDSVTSRNWTTVLKLQPLAHNAD